MSHTPKRKRRFWIAAVGTSAFLLLALLELDAQLAIRWGWITPVAASLPNESARQIAPEKQIYIAHPYFGYLYVPNSTFFQQTWMTSNSQGFIDREFPTRRTKSECVFGLLGGSSAMSWGTERNEDRLSFRLEALLNARPPLPRCRTYRVLNMGLGSGLIYQAAQIFFYYRPILDGAIFYFGHNECSHPSQSALGKSPVEFPEFPLATILGVDTTIVRQIQEDEARLAAIRARFSGQGLLAHSSLFRVTGAFLQYFLVREIGQMNRELQERTDRLVYGKKAIEDRELASFLPFTHDAYHYGDEKLRVALLGETLGRMVTNPLQNAFSVAKAFGIPTLAALQPMYSAVDRPLTPDEVNRVHPYPAFQKTCAEILPPYLQMLHARGMPTANLNRAGAFSDLRGDLFMDSIHLTPAGNAKAAEFLYRQISGKWR